jgi:DNA-directed RNA polymerase subunit E'
MRQAGLGTALWLEEDMNKEREKADQAAGVVKEQAPNKIKSRRKENAPGE